jgi:hypothetical protein
MGGYGSGRPGERTKVESCLSLDVNQLYRAALLLPGAHGRWNLKRRGTSSASIGVRCEAEELVLSYQLGAGEGASKSIEYAVSLTWLPCRHGGKRPYFLCPGVKKGRPCEKRGAKLYLQGGYFLCRHCHGLCYASQSEARHDRLLRRRNKLLRSLNPGGAFTLDPPRPKGMWQRTYEARLAEIRRLENEADTAFMSYIGEL